MTIPQHSLGRSAIYYDCLHYPGGMVNVITFEYNRPDVILGPYLVIISFSSSLSNYYDAGGRVLPLCYYFITLTH